MNLIFEEKVHNLICCQFNKNFVTFLESYNLIRLLRYQGQYYKQIVNISCFLSLSLLIKRDGNITYPSSIASPKGRVDELPPKKMFQMVSANALA